MRAFLLGLVAAGCTQSVSTPTGPLPAPTLVRTPGAVVPTETVPTRYRGTFEVCAGAPFPPAEVEVSWTGARRGAEAWLSEPAVKLLDAPDGLVVELMPNARVGGASLDPDAPWVELADLTFHCTRRQFRFPKLHEQALVGLVQLKATGEASIDGSPWKPTAPARP